MSNDITSATPRLPTAPVANSQPVHKPEVAARPALETPKPSAPAKADPKETRRALEEATQHLNQQMKRDNRDLSFSVDDLANTVVVTVKNRQSGEVVRQIPSEVALRVAHNMDNMKGLLQDSKS